jgi:hypothetical protein
VNHSDSQFRYTAVTDAAHFPGHDSPSKNGRCHVAADRNWKSFSGTKEMAKNSTKQATAESRRRDQFKKRKQGWSDGRKWIATCDHFDAHKFVKDLGWDVPWSSRTPWANCPFPELRKKLRSEGRDYTHLFIEAVQDAFKAEYSAHVFLRHGEGVQDGRRWAAEYATDGQIAQISNFSQSFWTRAVFNGPDPCESWTPAHRLVLNLLGDAYPNGEDGKPQNNCTEFREFWQPFVNEPMDEVMSTLELFGFRAGHKLQDRQYIAGFVDGALGLSENLKLRLSERTPTPLPTKERTRSEC